MEKNTLEKTIEELRKLMKEKHKNEEKIKELERVLFRELCPKHYLEDCEPAYCVFRITDSCEYLKSLRKIYANEGGKW